MARLDLVVCLSVDLIKLAIPSSLKYRDLVLRVVAAAAKLVGQKPGRPSRVDREFDDQVISAVGEAFNNAVLHSYRGRVAGDIEIEIETAAESIAVRLIDSGDAFDWTEVPEPNLDDLPESGLGVFIMRSFMDQVTYRAGDRNVLSMRKNYVQPTVTESASRPS